MAATYSNLLNHIVFATKQRMPLITSGIEQDLHTYIGGIIRQLDGTSLAINGMPDHVHILARFPPKTAAADAVRIIKANSSKWLNETKFKFQKFRWQDGYSIFSVSESMVPAVTQYILNQKEHHRCFDAKDELKRILDKHGIVYDTRYL